MPDELAVRRRYLLTRGLAETGAYDKALALLDGDTGRHANLLRADIYWAREDWVAEATVLDGLFRDRATDQPLDEEESGYLMKLAVSLALANNRIALADLRDRFGSLIDATPARDGFRALVSFVDGGPIDPADLSATVAEIDTYEAYMASLRERVSEGALSAIN